MKHNYGKLNQHGNEIVDALVENLTTEARMELAATLDLNDIGRHVFDVELKKPFYWDGEAWALPSGMALNSGIYVTEAGEGRLGGLLKETAVVDGAHTYGIAFTNQKDILLQSGLPTGQRSKVGIVAGAALLETVGGTERAATGTELVGDGIRARLSYEWEGKTNGVYVSEDIVLQAHQNLIIKGATDVQLEVNSAGDLLLKRGLLGLTVKEADPQGSAGTLYYNNNTKKFRGFDTQWRSLATETWVNQTLAAAIGAKYEETDPTVPAHVKTIGKGTAAVQYLGWDGDKWVPRQISFSELKDVPAGGNTGSITVGNISGLTAPSLVGRYSVGTGSAQAVGIGDGLMLNPTTGFLENIGVLKVNNYAGQIFLTGNNGLTRTNGPDGYINYALGGSLERNTTITVPDQNSTLKIAGAGGNYWQFTERNIYFEAVGPSEKYMSGYGYYKPRTRFTQYNTGMSMFLTAETADPAPVTSSHASVGVDSNGVRTGPRAYIEYHDERRTFSTTHFVADANGLKMEINTSATGAAFRGIYMDLDGNIRFNNFPSTRAAVGAATKVFGPDANGYLGLYTIDLGRAGENGGAFIWNQSTAAQADAGSWISGAYKATGSDIYGTLVGSLSANDLTVGHQTLNRLTKISSYGIDSWNFSIKGSETNSNLSVLTTGDLMFFGNGTTYPLTVGVGGTGIYDGVRILQPFPYAHITAFSIGDGTNTYFRVSGDGRAFINEVGQGNGAYLEFNNFAYRARVGAGYNNGPLGLEVYRPTNAYVSNTISAVTPNQSVSYSMDTYADGFWGSHNWMILGTTVARLHSRNGVVQFGINVADPKYTLDVNGSIYGKTSVITGDGSAHNGAFYVNPMFSATTGNQTGGGRISYTYPGGGRLYMLSSNLIMFDNLDFANTASGPVYINVQNGSHHLVWATMNGEPFVSGGAANAASYYHTGQHQFKGKRNGVWKNFLMEGDLANSGNFIWNQAFNATAQSGHFAIDGVGTAMQGFMVNPTFTNGNQTAGGRLLFNYPSGSRFYVQGNGPIYFSDFNYNIYGGFGSDGNALDVYGKTKITLAKTNDYTLPSLELDMSTGNTFNLSFTKQGVRKAMLRTGDNGQLVINAEDSLYLSYNGKDIFFGSYAAVPGNTSGYGMFWDESNRSLGINVAGYTSVNYTLDVNGNARIGSATLAKSVGENTKHIFAGLSGYTYVQIHKIDSDAVGGMAFNGALDLYTGSSSATTTGLRVSGTSVEFFNVLKLPRYASNAFPDNGTGGFGIATNGSRWWYNHYGGGYNGVVMPKNHSYSYDMSYVGPGTTLTDAFGNLLGAHPNFNHFHIRGTRDGWPEPVAFEAYVNGNGTIYKIQGDADTYLYFDSADGNKLKLAAAAGTAWHLSITQYQNNARVGWASLSSWDYGTGTTLKNRNLAGTGTAALVATADGTIQRGEAAANGGNYIWNQSQYSPAQPSSNFVIDGVGKWMHSSGSYTQITIPFTGSTQVLAHNAIGEIGFGVEARGTGGGYGAVDFYVTKIDGTAIGDNQGIFNVRGPGKNFFSITGNAGAFLLDSNARFSIGVTDRYTDWRGALYIQHNKVGDPTQDFKANAAINLFGLSGTTGYVLSAGNNTVGTWFQARQLADWGGHQAYNSLQLNPLGGNVLVGTLTSYGDFKAQVYNSDYTKGGLFVRAGYSGNGKTMEVVDINGDPRMIILGNGLTGLGTNAPEAGLHITRGGGTANAGLMVNPSYTSNGLLIKAGYSGYSHPFIIQDISGTLLYRMEVNGSTYHKYLDANDGVDYMVAVNNGVQKRMAIPSGGGGTPTLTAKQVAYGSDANAMTSSSLFTYDQNAVRVTLEGQATSPAYWLKNNLGRVAQLALAKADEPVYGTYGPGDAILYTDSGSGLVLLADYAGASIRFATAGAVERMRLTSGGSLHIYRAADVANPGLVVTGYSNLGNLRVMGNLDSYRHIYQPSGLLDIAVTWGQNITLSVNDQEERLRVRDGGVLIPNNKQLEVNGDIYSKKEATLGASGGQSVHGHAKWTANGTAMSAGAVVGATVSNLEYNLTGGAWSINPSNIHSAHINLLRLSSTEAATASVSQTGVRAFSGNGVQIQLAPVAAGQTSSLSHVAGVQIFGLYQDSGTTNSVKIDNYYALLIADTTEHLSWSGAVTAKWAIYQAGANDRSKFFGVIELNNDLEFMLADKGIIFKDSANGNRYKLQSTNGAVSLTQL